MSLSKEAIKELDDKTVVGKQIESLKVCDTPVIALPEDYRVASLEKFHSQRSRYRAQFKTTVLAEFTKYTNKEKPASCFINTEGMMAKSIFDLGDTENPGHAENTATLSLIKTAPYMEALRLNEWNYRQKEFAEWLEDWRDYIETIDEDGKPYDIKKAISAVRKLSIEAVQKSEHTDTDLGREKSAIEKIEAKSDDTLPMTFIFKCKPYEDLEEREIKFRVSILTSHTAPEFKLRIVHLNKLSEEILIEFRGLLKKSFDKDISAYLGTLSTN